MMLFLDADAHGRVRRITMKAFTARAIAQLRPVTEQLAGTLLDEVWAEGYMDLVSGFAYELPIQVIAQLLGVPAADFPVIKEFAYHFARGSELSPVETDRTRRADTAALAFGDYFGHLAAKRRGDPQDDVLSALVTAEDEGVRLSHQDVVGLRSLLERLPRLRAASDTFEWRNTLRNRGPQELRIAWDVDPAAP